MVPFVSVCTSPVQCFWPPFGGLRSSRRCKAPPRFEHPKQSAEERLEKGRRRDEGGQQGGSSPPRPRGFRISAAKSTLTKASVLWNQFAAIPNRGELKKTKAVKARVSQVRPLPAEGWGGFAVAPYPPSP